MREQWRWNLRESMSASVLKWIRNQRVLGTMIEKKERKQQQQQCGWNVETREKTIGIRGLVGKQRLYDTVIYGKDLHGNLYWKQMEATDGYYIAE